MNDVCSPHGIGRPLIPVDGELGLLRYEQPARLRADVIFPPMVRPVPEPASCVDVHARPYDWRSEVDA